MEQYFKERAEVAITIKRLYDRQLTTVGGGNVSLRIGENLMAITPSKIDKGNLTDGLIALVDLETGENLTPELPLSIESGMHRSIYLERKDVNAIVHAHPVFASAFSTGAWKVNTSAIAETHFMLTAEVPNAPYAIMGSRELAENVAQTMRSHDVAFMKNHGAVSVGKRLIDAFNLMEILENACKMTVISKVMGDNPSMDLSADNIAELDRMKYGK